MIDWEQVIESKRVFESEWWKRAKRAIESRRIRQMKPYFWTQKRCLTRLADHLRTTGWHQPPTQGGWFLSWKLRLRQLKIGWGCDCFCLLDGGPHWDWATTAVQWSCCCCCARAQWYIRCLLCFSVSPVRDTKEPQDIQRCGVWCFDVWRTG